MTTQSSPDGSQTPPPNSGAPQTPPPAGGEEEIRNWSDAKKAFITRDELKAENQQLRALIDGLGTKLDALGKPPSGPPPGQSPQGDQSPPLSPLEQQVKTIADGLKQLTDERGNAAKADRRKAITDAVASAAKDDQREFIRGALAMLALDGEIDMHAEQTSAEVEKALTKLRAKHPSAFATASSTSNVTGNGHDLIPAGVPLHELTAEQLARLSDEDFSKARRAARTSKLAV